jgi:mRNA interferase MazF
MSNFLLGQVWNLPLPFVLKKEDSGLEKDSVINVSQIITIDKEILTELVGIIGAKYIKRVEQGIKTVLFLK